MLTTLAAGVALAEGVAAATGLQVDLKWPNDLHVSRRKLDSGRIDMTFGQLARVFGERRRNVVSPRIDRLRAANLVQAAQCGVRSWEASSGELIHLDRDGVLRLPMTGCDRATTGQAQELLP